MIGWIANEYQMKKRRIHIETFFLKREKNLILQKVEKPYFHTSSQRVVGILKIGS
jgi:hypothetical protein